jgi:hypothetical protein
VDECATSILTIEKTLAPDVFEFVMGKNGESSGWERNAEGYYVRYFARSSKGTDWYWSPATQAQTLTALRIDEFSRVFASEDDLTFDDIKERFKSFGYTYSAEEIEEFLNDAVANGDLINLEVDGETVWRGIKVAKSGKKSAAQTAKDT